MGDDDHRGADSNDMGDNLPVIDFGDDFTPIKLAATCLSACALSAESTIKCWGKLSALLLSMAQHLKRYWLKLIDSN